MGIELGMIVGFLVGIFVGSLLGLEVCYITTSDQAENDINIMDGVSKFQPFHNTFYISISSCTPEQMRRNQLFENFISVSVINLDAS